MHRIHAIGDLPETLPLFPLSGVILLPHGALPLNVFEPRYLALVDDALKADRLIGIIQPQQDDDAVLKPELMQVGAAGRIVAFRETEDNRYLITLEGLCRFRMLDEMAADTPYRQARCDYAPYAHDLTEAAEGTDIDRDRLVAVLKAYLSNRDMKADWKSVMAAPPETLVNALSMMCPFEPAEKQALLEAPDLAQRAMTLMALLEMAPSPHRAPTLN